MADATKNNGVNIPPFDNAVKEISNNYVDQKTESLHDCFNKFYVRTLMDRTQRDYLEDYINEDIRTDESVMMHFIEIFRRKSISKEEALASASKMYEYVQASAYYYVQKKRYKALKRLLYPLELEREVSKFAKSLGRSCKAVNGKKYNCITDDGKEPKIRAVLAVHVDLNIFKS